MDGDGGAPESFEYDLATAFNERVLIRIAQLPACPSYDDLPPPPYPGEEQRVEQAPVVARTGCCCGSSTKKRFFSIVLAFVLLHMSALILYLFLRLILAK